MDDSVNNDYYVDLRNVTARELYDLICSEMSFNKVIELYRLINYKLNNLDDELISCISVAAYESDSE